MKYSKHEHVINPTHPQFGDLCKCVAMYGYQVITDSLLYTKTNSHWSGFKFKTIEYDYELVNDRTLRIRKPCTMSYVITNNYDPKNHVPVGINYHDGLPASNFRSLLNTLEVNALHAVMYEYLERLNRLVLKELKVLHDIYPDTNISVMFKNIFTPKYDPVTQEFRFSTEHYFHTSSGLIERAWNDRYEQRYKMDEKAIVDDKNMLKQMMKMNEFQSYAHMLSKKHIFSMLDMGSDVDSYTSFEMMKAEDNEEGI